MQTLMRHNARKQRPLCNHCTLSISSYASTTSHIISHLVVSLDASTCTVRSQTILPRRFFRVISRFFIELIRNVS